MGPVADAQSAVKRILGLDPGLNHLGWAVIETEGPATRAVAFGVFDVPKGELPERLSSISKHLTVCIGEYRPDCAAIERVFVNVNPQSTLRLGEARGAAIAALALAGLPVEEFTPSEIKQCITGTGRADKAMVQRMVTTLLGLTDTPRTDAADALGCAITCAQTMRLRALERSGGTTRTYATARRGASGRGARAAWAKFAGEK